MHLTIDLAPEEEEQLAELAARQRVSATDYVRGLIQRHITAQSHIASTTQDARRQRALRVLRSGVVA